MGIMILQITDFDRVYWWLVTLEKKGVQASPLAFEVLIHQIYLDIR